MKNKFIEHKKNDTNIANLTLKQYLNDFIKGMIALVFKDGVGIDVCYNCQNNLCPSKDLANKYMDYEVESYFISNRSILVFQLNGNVDLSDLKLMEKDLN